jgi:hypothetical protein
MKKLAVLTGLVALALLPAGFAARAGADPVLPPVTGLHSPSHPQPAQWYANRHVSFAWTPLVGVAGYSCLFDQSATTVPDADLDVAALSFAAKTDFATGTAPVALAVADFNGDGTPDLAAVSPNDGKVGVLLGDGTGGLAAKVDYATGASPSGVAVGDFDRNGKPDLAVSNYSDDTVSILLGDGSGAFAAKVDYPTASRPTSLVVADFNKDGKPDLAVGDDAPDTVSVLLGKGDGTLGTKTDYTTGNDTVSVCVGDFDGDGNLDLATANYVADNVSVLLGDGSGGFAAKTDYPIGSLPNSIVAADFNGDGRADLAMSDRLGGASVLLANAAGGFDAQQTYDAESYPTGIALGDFNGDGAQDLLVANWGLSTVSVLCGDGTGGFATAMNYATGSLPDAVAVGDFNGDGRTDVAAANGDDDTASVLLNTTPSPAGAYDATSDGLWYCHVCAVDGFGSWGPAATAAVRIDTHRPTTTARRAVVVRGHIASLRCGVSDARPCAGWAAVKVCVRNSRGKIVHRLTYSHKPTGWFLAKFRCKLAKGVYRYYVSATDAAGNRQSKLGWNRLIVK